MSLPQSNLPPVVLAGGPPVEPDRRRQRRMQRLADAGIALLLLLALGLVFLSDLHSPGRDAIYGRNASSERFLFDPLRSPLAEVRQNPQRKEWIGAYGGTLESELAVGRGLDWLARHQSADGHWGPDALHARPDGRCKQGDVCPNGGAEHRVALTGLAVLAFQAGGHYDFDNNPYSECVRQGLNWLLKHQREDGCFLDREHGTGECNMYEHGIAAFALADACEMAASLDREPADRYQQATQKAVQFIHYAQHDDGGWRYTDREEDRHGTSDASVSGWQVLALKTARRAGVSEIGEDCVTGMERFFKACEDKTSGRTFYQPGHNLPSDAPTAIGMLVQQFILEQPDSLLVKRGAEYLAHEAETSFQNGRKQGKKKQFAAAPGDHYTFYNGTLAMFQAGGPPWRRWNDVVRDTLVDLQCGEEEGCRRGSWDPLGRWSPEGGRIYCTALAVLTLEVYYRYKSERAKVYPERRKDEGGRMKDEG
jgi:hypothetical protein